MNPTPPLLTIGQRTDPDACWCESCDEAGNRGMRTRMSVCPTCGDKRCPRARSHENVCTKYSGTATERTARADLAQWPAPRSIESAPKTARVFAVAVTQPIDDAHKLWAGWAEKLERELAAVTAERDALNEALRGIGDYAHDRSTGPAVPDALWEIRSMAYDALLKKERT